MNSFSGRNQNKGKKVGEKLAETNKKRQRRFSLKDEVILAIMPTIMVILVLLLVQGFTQQRILFASLASSAFLIYRDPTHPMNNLYSLLISQSTGAIAGVASYYLFGSGYFAAAVAMIVTITIIIAANAIHPPAIGTALSFGFSSPKSDLFGLFFLALIMIAALVIIQQVSLWLLSRFENHNPHPEKSSIDNR